MTEQKHTPMRIAGKSSNDGEAFIIENNERTVCWTADSLNTLGVGVIAEKDKDLAEFIVKACNAHDELVGFLNAIGDCVDDAETVDFIVNNWDKIEDLLD